MPGGDPQLISLMRGSALLEALLAAALLAMGTATHMRMLSEALHEHSNGIWHKRAQNINQALRTRLLAGSMTADSPAYAAAINAWQLSARNVLPASSTKLSTATVTGLQRIELRISWNAAGRGGSAVLYLYSAAS